ncbi:biphenyl-2,3-diol 1,2-dioxygenase [Salinisphaera sp. T5B8]|uniref:VOC family protein n=1 Tax=Salinisphaera sp. T5B8 TaxID=1304154 RepID=UPI00334149D6
MNAETATPIQEKQPHSGPKYIAHWVLKTPRRDKLVDWYKKVFGAEVVHSDDMITFLSWDEESHRLALVSLPRALRFVFPFGSRLRRKIFGIDHIAHSFGSLEALLSSYARIKQQGIKPVWCINHGPTTSIYYEDPDGNRHEFQVDNFPTLAETKKYFDSQEFADNPIGVNFDPDYLLERLKQGTPEKELLKRGAGTRPGTRQPENKKTLTWRTL